MSICLPLFPICSAGAQAQPWSSRLPSPLSSRPVFALHTWQQNYSASSSEPSKRCVYNSFPLTIIHVCSMLPSVDLRLDEGSRVQTFIVPILPLLLSTSQPPSPLHLPVGFLTPLASHLYRASSICFHSHLARAVTHIRQILSLDAILNFASQVPRLLLGDIFTYTSRIRVFLPRLCF